MKGLAGPMRCVMALVLAVAEAAPAMEPVNTSPPCEKVAFHFSGQEQPTWVVDSYFTYHFDYALLAARNLESLASLSQCTEVIQRLEVGRQRRRGLAADAAASPEPYRTRFQRELQRSESVQSGHLQKESLVRRLLDLGRSADLQPSEACTLLWGEFNANYDHNAVTFSNRVSVELPMCANAPTRVYKEPR